MPRKFLKKESKFLGLIQNGEGSSVSSFLGRINGGPLKHYIGVNVEGEWLTISQAKRLARLLDEHIDRVEGAKGALLMSGSSRYRKGSKTGAFFIGYSEEKVSDFLSDVEDLLRKHFIHWETDYKWKVSEGQKTLLSVNFHTWLSTLKMKAGRKKAGA